MHLIPSAPIPPRIVAIGGSAGALSALSKFFQASFAPPQDVVFVIVVHLSPDSPSHLADILSKDTTLPVSVIQDGGQLKAGHVYVIASGTSVEVIDGKFKLRRAAERPAVPMPIDLFFNSLAQAQGARAIAIVLTGANADGSAGVRAIKAQGGMVMAQAPDTAEHDSMPKNAIATGMVDYILPIEQLPLALFDCIEGSSATTEPDLAEKRASIDLEPVLDALLVSGCDFRGYKRGTLERRIARRMVVNRIDNFTAYCRFLNATPAETKALSLDMMIGVTEFFRDPDAWDALAEHVLSELLAEPDTTQPLRIWVPGCATGEEAYSMAMLLTEQIEQRGIRRTFLILATDMSRPALGRARRGIYTSSAASSLGKTRLARFFNVHGDEYQIKPELRATILFAPQNLIADPPFSRIDLISCRNLLIYLEQDAQQRVFELFHFALNPGRYLFLGRSESTSPGSSHFQETSKAWRIYQRGPSVAPSEASYRFATKAVHRQEVPRERRVGGHRKGHAELVNETLLARDHAASVLINEAQQVLYVSGAADEYLKQPSGEPSVSILDLAREELRLKLRIALRRANQEPADSCVGEIVRNGSAPAVKITVLRPSDATSIKSGFLVVFARQPALEREDEAHSLGEDPDVRHLEQELRTTQVEFASVIEDLESSNSDLRVSNEEILSINEELRSSNEEIEASKEELQSVNEEVSVINAQLEKKVRELEALSSDMTNFLASTQIATLLLDQDGLIRRFTPSAARIFGLALPDIGRAIRDIPGNPFSTSLLADVREVFAKSVQQTEKEIETATGEWYVRRVMPYIVDNGASTGVVVTLTDVTRMRRANEQSRRLAAVVRDSNDAVTVFDLRGRFIAWNRTATAMYGYSEAEALTMNVVDLLPKGARQEHLDFIQRGSVDKALHSYETQRIAKNGKVINMWITLSLLSDELGNLTAVATTERDLADRSRNNAQLRARAERLALADERKNEFLAMLGHELRNPLSALSASANVLASDAAQAAQKTWAVGIIQRQCRAMTRLVNDMLDLTRITRGSIELHRQPAELKSIIESAIEVCQPIIDERSHRLSVSMPDETVWLYVDATRLSQAVENILINAAKYTAPGGEISLDAQKIGARVSLRIRDNGRGIAPSMLDTLFDLFIQGPVSHDQPNSGLGVGLSVVRRLVELHGGTVKALSDGQAGSEFVVDLPIDVIPFGDNPEAIAERPVRARFKRILIIDDNADASEALAILLTSEGHEVETRLDGPQGIDLMPRFKPDVVLLDIGLPGMSGLEVAKQIRSVAETRATMLIALTGHGQADDRIRSAEAGFDFHLTKPVELGVLIQLLASEAKSATKI
jgi:two-component system CheB/CheR fusion protein